MALTSQGLCGAAQFSRCAPTLIMNGSPKCCPCSRMVRKYGAKPSSFAARRVSNMVMDVVHFQELNIVRETRGVAFI